MRTEILFVNLSVAVGNKKTVLRFLEVVFSTRNVPWENIICVPKNYSAF